MDLAARQQALQQRLRELGAKAQQIELSLVETRAEALKVAGALELLQQLIQERDGQAAQAVTHTTGDRSAMGQIHPGETLLP